MKVALDTNVLAYAEGVNGAEKRDIVADFKRIYADESPEGVPPLIGIAIGADSDNTKMHTVAHAADVVLAP